jgi:hypothetical protein
MAARGAAPRVECNGRLRTFMSRLICQKALSARPPMPFDTANVRSYHVRRYHLQEGRNTTKAEVTRRNFGWAAALGIAAAPFLLFDIGRRCVEAEG